MADNRIRMKVMGLSIGQIQKGAYALILAEANGPVRIPVVIGLSEAQAIAARMEHVTTPRPMTHDLFSSMAHAFGIAVQEVFIHTFADGIYLSEITMTDGERRVTLDSRTSDAIAIAMRTGAPIYTTREILEHCGFIIKDEPATPDSDGDNEADAVTDTVSGEFIHNYDQMSTEQLEKLRDMAVADENYEEAARITNIINSRNQQ